MQLSNSLSAQYGVRKSIPHLLQFHLELTNRSTGAFDIVSEFLPHVSIILYRVYPTSHRFLRKIFRLACITTLIGTTAETIVTMWVFGKLWDQWTIAFKVTTPMLHLLFAAA